MSKQTLKQLIVALLLLIFLTGKYRISEYSEPQQFTTGEF